MGEIVVEAGRNKYVVRDDLLYTESDEWVRVEGDEAVVGITDYAQKKLRDIIGVELPEEGASVRKGDAVAVVESVKHTSDVYSPLTGTVVAVNERLYDEPELINKDPYGEGWLFRIKIADKDELGSLLSPEKYAEKIREKEQG